MLNAKLEDRLSSTAWSARHSPEGCDKKFTGNGVGDGRIRCGVGFTTRASTDFDGKQIDLRNCNKDVSAETHINVSSLYTL